MDTPVRPIWFQRLYRTTVAHLAIRAPAVAKLLPMPVPLRQYRLAVGPGRTDDLIVFLPGIDDFAGDFALHGFQALLRRRGIAADTLEVDAHVGYYLCHRLPERLEVDVLAPARRAGYRRLWLVGLSLGGLGAIRYTGHFGAELAGVVLLAPFLGFRRTVRAIRVAGGLRAWEPPPTADTSWEVSVWSWAKQRLEDPCGPELWLAFGEQDGFAPAGRMLAEVLPAERVVTVPGGHDWSTWLRLWDRMLAGGLFTTAPKREYRGC